MRLPNRDAAAVADAKLIGYLLNTRHPAGGPKAEFLLALGHDARAPEVLRRDLLAVARDGQLVETLPSAYGVKHVVDGWLHPPGGHARRIRTVWVVEPRGGAPRLVTAYPRSQEGR